MALKYQKGTVYPRGKKVKMWYGKYTVYFRDETGKEVGKRRNVPLCPKAGTTKWKAEQMLHALILKETGMPAKTGGAIEDDSVTFRWFVGERYLPMRQGAWSPAYRRINSYEINHYLVEHFGRIPLGQLGTFEIQVWLNKLATMYSQSVVRHCYVNIRSITRMARKLNFLTTDPGLDVTMPQTKPVPKPIMNQEQIIALIGGIKDLHDLCLIYVGIFCGPRASEVLGLQWKSWTGTTLVPYGTAYEGNLYPGRFKTRASQAPIGVPEQVRPVIQAWQQVCPDPSPEALMFPTFGRGDTQGTSRAALEQELPDRKDQADCPAARHPGPARYVSGDAPNAGYSSSASRDTQGCARGSAPREHPDDWGCLHAGDRGKCAAGAEFPNVRDPVRLEADARLRRSTNQRRVGSGTKEKERKSREGFGPKWTK